MKKVAALHADLARAVLRTEDGLQTAYLDLRRGKWYFFHAPQIFRLEG
ncbi:hypothetical protein [Phyllobacterium zundukense]|nr:hypothetical protein [Phyllobacterium zundukense]